MMESISFRDCIENYDFDNAFEKAKGMTENEIECQLSSIFYETEQNSNRMTVLPFSFAYKYKLLINDIRWNYVLMRLIDTAYICYKGMPDIALECASKILELDDSNLRALQYIVYCYELCESHCSEELYTQAKKKMDELGYTMRS